MAGDVLKRGFSVKDLTGDSPVLKEYLRNGGVNLDPAVADWCAAFISSTLAQEGFQRGGDVALSFKKYGDEVHGSPQPGDIGVFSRWDDPDHTDWKGHAAFFTGKYDDIGNPIVLSGNAGDEVAEHAIDPNRLIGWRRPTGKEADPVNQRLLSPREQMSLPDILRDFNQSVPNIDQRTRTAAGPLESVGATTTPYMQQAFMQPDRDWNNIYRLRRLDEQDDQDMQRIQQNGPIPDQVVAQQLSLIQPRPQMTGDQILNRIRNY